MDPMVAFYTLHFGLGIQFPLLQLPLSNFALIQLPLLHHVELHQANHLLESEIPGMQLSHLILISGIQS